MCRLPDSPLCTASRRTCAPRSTGLRSARPLHLRGCRLIATRRVVGFPECGARDAEAFRIGEIPCPREWAYAQARLTLDTEEDYALLQEVFSDLYAGRPVEIEEVVGWLKRHTLRATS